jgi:hypothetical protein
MSGSGSPARAHSATAGLPGAWTGNASSAFATGLSAGLIFAV